jgi:uncharacterized protein
MAERNEVFFRCGSIVLEGVIEIPDGVDRPSPGAVICHPHPLYGGNMYNNVTGALKKGLLARGVMCLRFNFRGTGRSEGSHGEGVDELEDVRAAVDFLSQQKLADPEKIIVAGYSFGCWVGLRAASTDRRPTRLIGISPPVDHYDFSFLLGELRPKLLMAGDRDFVCSKDKFLRLVEEIPEPKQSSLIPGGDHFHVGREHLLVTEMNGFLEKYPLPDGRNPSDV